MRLTESEIRAIQETFLDVFESGEIFLFGSRIDDTKRGGDIDLYISTPYKDGLVRRKIDFLVKLKRKIGEQKIDVVLDRGQDNPIDRVAKQGVLLCKK